MTTKTKFALGALFVLLLFAGIYFSPGSGEPVAAPDFVPPVPVADRDDAPWKGHDDDATAEMQANTDEVLLAVQRAAVKAALFGKRPPDVRGPLPGRVTSEDSDEPVVGAKITVKWDFVRSGGRWPEGGVYEWTVVTDHRGEFRFEDLPAGRYTLVATHTDYASRGLSGIEVKASGDVVPFPVHLVDDPSKLGVVTGVVLDPFGDAIEGVEVVVHTFSDLVRQEGVTGPDGSYRIERLLPGHYRVSVVRPAEQGGSGKLWERTQSAAVRPGEDTRVDFRGSGTLSGIVLDADGDPIADARVVLWHLRDGASSESRRGRTGKDGRFEIADAGLGRRQLLVGVGNSAAHGEEIDLSGSDREIEIRLETGQITGTVRLADGCPPWSTGAFPGIVATSLDGERPGSVASTGGLDVGGKFQMRGLPPGRYRISVHAKGYRRLSADVTISRETPKVTKDFKLEKLVIGQVRITVTDPAGNPVLGIRMSYGERGIVGRSVDRDMPSPGVYLSRMEVGKWVLVLSGDRLETKSLDIEVKPDVETELRVEMSWKD